MSIINSFKKYYSKIPLEVINTFEPLYKFVPISFLYGKTYRNQIRSLKSLENISLEETNNVINIEFLKLVNYAYKNVPYYHTLFDQQNILISSIKSIQDIVKIPFLTKEILIEKREELISTNIDRKKLQYITTSGSTGNPVAFYVDSNSTMKEWAYTVYIWSRVGYTLNSSRLLLRGKTFWAQKHDGKNWQYDKLRKELSCNIFDLSDLNMEEYCLAIEKYKPDFVHGYMSAITIFCKYIEKRGNKLNHHFKAVLAVSENVLKSQRMYVERILETRVFSFYGHSERLVIAGECEFSNEYHIEPTYGYAEIIDSNGIVIKDGRIGELVTTGFCNKGMPMIRYKTGDMASWSSETKCQCGRNHVRLIDVYGRWKQDYLVNQDNSLVSLTAINMHSDVFDKIIKYQFFQEKAGDVIMKIVVNSNFNNSDKKEIIYQLNEKTQNKIRYHIEIVDSIPVNKNGKYSIVDQHIHIKNYD